MAKIRSRKKSPSGSHDLKRYIARRDARDARQQELNAALREQDVSAGVLADRRGRARVSSGTRQAPRRYTEAGPVTITRADGVSRTDGPYSPKAFRKIVREREPISAALRNKIMRRDGGRCRYCGTLAGPFEIDHVLPVADGGLSTMRNLVTACRECNQKKGTAHWVPRPLRSFIK